MEYQNTDAIDYIKLIEKLHAEIKLLQRCGICKYHYHKANICGLKDIKIHPSGSCEHFE